MEKDDPEYSKRVGRAATRVPIVAGQPQDPRRVRGIGRHEIVIGIPYRDEAFGEAILKDIDVVAEGTQCRVLVIRPNQTLDDVHVDALFIPGGRFDQPDTIPAEGSKARWPRDEQKSLLAELHARHNRELTIIKQAEQRNIPILGVCGGSRRLATAKGAAQRHLTEAEARVHTSNMETVATRIAHPITISSGTMLHRIVASGNYRLIPPREVRRQVEKDIEIAVNSVHWASSHFPQGSPVKVSATHEGVVEGFEDPRYHYHLGVQWHPEHAQLGQGGFAGRAEPHQRVMASLGQAAQEGRAARILQSGIRGLLARRRLAELREAQQTTSLLPPSSAAVAAATVSTSPTPFPGVRHTHQPPQKSLPSPTISSPGYQSGAFGLSTLTTSPGSQSRSQISPPRRQPSPQQNPLSPPSRSQITSPSKSSVIASHTGPTPARQGGQTSSPFSASSTKYTPVQAPVLLQPTVLRGIVKFYDPYKRFGYIAGADGWDYYFDATAISSGFPRKGDRVTFEAVKSGKDWNASRVVVL